MTPTTTHEGNPGIESPTANRDSNAGPAVLPHGNRAERRARASRERRARRRAR